MAYILTFYTHVTCATISIVFFIVRGWWMIQEDPRLTHRFTRIAPHIVDTVLLGSALALAVMLQQYPFVDSWLTVKVFALVAYILLGMVALKRGKTRAIRISAFLGAILVFAFIVSVAYFHHPAGVFSLRG